MGAADHPPQVAVREGIGPAPVLLVCEHASNTIPACFGTLGLDDEARVSHIAWDLGALDLARALAVRFDAPLMRAAVSRLVFDLNRPPDAADAIPERSELTDIPGNMGLSASARQARIDQIHSPWATALGSAVETDRPAALISVHSFTPMFAGTPRSTEIGIIHDQDARLASAVIARSRHLGWQRNRPYGPADGVTHTLKTYAEPRGIHPLMLEIRNDLLKGPEAVNRVAAGLASVIIPALEECGIALRKLVA